jgi:hypothetical protein
MGTAQVIRVRKLAILGVHWSRVDSRVGSATPILPVLGRPVRPFRWWGRGVPIVDPGPPTSRVRLEPINPLDSPLLVR